MKMKAKWMKIMFLIGGLLVAPISLFLSTSIGLPTLEMLFALETAIVIFILMFRNDEHNSFAPFTFGMAMSSLAVIMLVIL